MNLHEHRQLLAGNPAAYTEDLPRARDTVVTHLKQCGYGRVTRNRCADLIAEYVDTIFATQDNRPFFHIDANLPYCWNGPEHWDENYIRYEWGHLHSRNQNPQAAYHIENLCLQSARCNQHVQTSLDIEEVIEWLDGSPVAERARAVLARRKELFRSQGWQALVSRFEQFKVKP